MGNVPDVLVVNYLIYPDGSDMTKFSPQRLAQFCKLCPPTIIKQNKLEQQKTSQNCEVPDVLEMK